MHFTLALTSLYVCMLSFTNALPFTELQSRQTDNECAATAQVYRASCWDKYDLSNYLKDWNQTYSKTTCGTVEDPLDCDTSRTCLTDEPWSSCYLRIALQKAGESCLSLDGQGCDKNSKLDDHLDPSIVSQVRYVVRSIYMVESFFGSYFSALGDAITNVNLIIGSIVRTIDPKKNTALSMSTVLTALTVGLSFLTAPALGASAISSVSHAGLQKAASVWATSLAQAPGVAKSIWPQGSEESITWQINEIQDQIKDITTGYMNMLDNGLKAVMLDPDAFIEFADHGVFATNNPLDIVDTLNYTGLALQTYIVSEALAQNKWYITPGKTSTLEEFKRDIQPKPCQPINVGAGGLERCTQSRSTADEWYWSPTTTRRYHFQVMNNEKVSPLSAADMMSTIINNGWTTLDILFDGAYDCALSGNFGSGNVIRIDDTTHSIDTTCISHLPLKSECGLGCAIELPAGQSCPFDDDCVVVNGCLSIHGGQGCGLGLGNGLSEGNSTLDGPATKTHDLTSPETSTPPQKPCIAQTIHGGGLCAPGTGMYSSS